MQSPVTQDQAAYHVDQDSREFLVFTLGDEQYGIEILMADTD